MRLHTLRSIAAAAALALLAAGCGSAENDVRDLGKTSARSATDTKSALGKGKAQIDVVLARLRLLMESTSDLDGARKGFGAEVDRTHDVADDLRSRAADMKDHAEEYLRVWREERGSMESADVSDERRAQTKLAWDEVLASMQRVREVAKPFSDRLDDFRRTVDTTSELTAARLATYQPTAQGIQTDGASVKARIDATIAAMEEFARAAGNPK